MIENSANASNHYDAIVIGGGINGCAATQELCAAGYRVILIEKGDFASGSSSRSSRLVHCGLRYFAPGGSPYDFLAHPSLFHTALTMTRKAMQARRELVERSPSRVRPFTFGFPIWHSSPYKPWQVDLELRIVDGVGPGSPPLNRKLLKPGQFGDYPLFAELREQSKLRSVNTYTEYQFNWPERVAIDMVLDAKRMGATCRNYTSVVDIKPGKQTRWQVTIADRDTSQHEEVLHTDVIVNTTGIWIDGVNKLATPNASRRVLGTKGAHIVIQLPPEFSAQGVMSMNQKGTEPVYLIPWKYGLHYMAVTETVYDGDIDDIHADDEDIDWLLAEFNNLLPGLRKTRDDVLYTWAGVRPLTYDPALPKGARNRKLVDLTEDGLPGMLTMTAGPIVTHRSAGLEIVAAVKALKQPSSEPRQANYSPVDTPTDTASPALLNHDDTITIADLRHCAQHEQVRTLTDLLARRTGLAWTSSRAREGARVAADSVADLLAWDQQRVDKEVNDYLHYVDHTLRKPN